jgi:hypothetical protein
VALPLALLQRRATPDRPHVQELLRREAPDRPHAQELRRHAALAPADQVVQAAQLDRLGPADRTARTARTARLAHRDHAPIAHQGARRGPPNRASHAAHETPGVFSHATERSGS